MKKNELSGADGEIRFVVLSDPATASLVKNLSDHNMIMHTSFNVEDDFIAIEIMVGDPLGKVNN